MIGGFITKILGMIIKIVTTRYLGTTGMGLYSLVLPTYALLITLSQLGIPLAISKLVSEEKVRGKKIVLPVIPLIIVINLFIIFTMLILSKFIAVNLLHNESLKNSLFICSLVLPFISISSIIRNYFFGHQKVLPHVFSNVIEDIVRLVILVTCIPFYLSKGLIPTINFIIVSNIVCELISIIVLVLFLPKKVKIEKKDFKVNKVLLKDIFSIGLPVTGSRLLTNFIHFLEPIILTTILLNVGYNNDYIINEFGIINGYIIPLLLLPSFFTGAISQALLPIVSKAYVNNHKKYAWSKIKQAIFFSLMIGIPTTILLMLVPEFFMNILYKSVEGINYLYFLAPFFLLYYIQIPLQVSMQAINKAKEGLYITMISLMVKLLSLIILSYFFGMWSLIVSIGINILITTFLQYIKVKKYML